jgi:hypothetical protein
MRFAQLFLLCLALGWILTALREPARATITAVTAPPPVHGRIHVEMLPMNLDSTVDSATHIVQGQVVSSWVDVSIADALDPTATTFAPITRYELAVVGTPLKGSLSGSTIYVDVAGAEESTGRFIVDGAPAFQSGDDVLLFLEEDTTRSAFGIVGLSQGAYRVRQAQSSSPTVDGRHAADGTSLATFAAEIDVLREN